MTLRSLLASFAILATASAFAAPPAPVPSDNPCMTDIHKYCKDVIPGGGRLAQCMKKHATELSSGCKSYGKDYVREHPEIQKSLGSG